MDLDDLVCCISENADRAAQLETALLQLEEALENAKLDGETCYRWRQVVSLATRISASLAWQMCAERWK